ncbi:Holliday junction branch migration protein RuvA [Candidatus Parcubacteria bacterium]|nr:Holliday junction branch migration protein RuvA [Patescibacteria group bacterium]MBU4481995.1 Holliday junction branch migration protein RuvA [Patescibacteria group bacterium]MCG2686732.1 Holliday junction branch migration protein RuvA [Candidatus Parcubacteria bacterium]
MISYLSGAIKYKSNKSLTLNVNGVGYEIFVSETVLEKTKIDEKKEFFISSYIREDAFNLYGFESQEEKRFFELLISISGVGPKSALQTLSIAKLSEIKKAILRDDPSLLKKVSGIGTKTAERIVVELKNKLDNLPVGKDEKVDLTSGGQAGAFEALQSLGYLPQEIRDALRKVPSEIEIEDEIIKYILKKIGKNKN